MGTTAIGNNSLGNVICFREITPMDNDDRFLTGEPPSDRLANSLAASRDQCNLAVQF
ncbi:hypothetical protein ABIB57_003723 [Devosia sp. UYZn731]